MMISKRVVARCEQAETRSRSEPEEKEKEGEEALSERVNQKPVLEVTGRSLDNGLYFSPFISGTIARFVESVDVLSTPPA